MKNLIFLEEVLRQSPRLIGLLNRNPVSENYGCFDREYWHYNVVDFPCARKQEAVLTLALLYKIKSNINKYYNQSILLDWINSSLKFWTKIQEKNGSLNEWYPKENSFVATAFGLYAISETILLLGYKVENKELVIKHIKKAADWLLRKDEKRVLNQEAGAAIALYNVYLLTKDEKYKKAAEDKIDFIIKNQVEEGWFYEYGGPDIGYLSLTIDYLSKYYQKTKNKELKKVIDKSIDFIKYFVLSNNVGGCYGSRNTEYLMPDGFAIMGAVNNDAASINQCIVDSLGKSSVFLNSVDDRYLSYTSYTFLQAYLNFSKIRIFGLPYKVNFQKEFSKAGIKIFSNNKFYLIVNYDKGGCFSLYFKKNKKLICDCGILLLDKNGKKLTSSYLGQLDKTKIMNNGVLIKSRFSVIDENLMSPMKNIALKSFQLTLGRNEKISLYTKEKLRDILISKLKKAGVIYSRRISIDDSKILVVDKVIIKDLKEIIIGSDASYIYVPSSRYFKELSLNQKIIRENLNNKKGIFLIERKFDFKGDIKIDSKYLSNAEF